ncbi:hypothetical protein P7L87_23970 [Vibrio parahaemolyticus]|nr:hypothetical protein [Vibrio parahaemolyticus]
MEPANTIIKLLGGPTRVAEAVNVHRTRVHSWMRPREKGGTGGVIPHWHVPKLLAFAQKKGVKLKRTDFAPQHVVIQTGEAA